MGEKIKVAVLVDFHPYDAINFQKMFESFGDCECYVQPLSLFVQDRDNKASYDTVAYYNMNKPAPKKGSAIEKYFAEELGAGRQGAIFIHHALLSFEDWPPFTEICGLGDRGAGEKFKYTQNQSVNAIIADAGHPITAGVADFSMIDETYVLDEPDIAGNRVLIRTDNETSVKSIAWTRQYKGSRVFCFASGHDDRAFANPGFRKVLHNAIRWTSGR
jgi:hypothetical protein